jgi:tripartite-type tricarboxylate transporter receptor subunit TctC
MKRRDCLKLAIGAVSMGLMLARTDIYPSRTITLIAPFATGPTDVIARLIGGVSAKRSARPC